LNPNYDVINDVISGFAKVVVERCGFHHWIAQRISWSEVVFIFLYLLQFPSYDVINDVTMSDADCTPGGEPRSVAASCNSTSILDQGDACSSAICSSHDTVYLRAGTAISTYLLTRC